MAVTEGVDEEVEDGSVSGGSEPTSVHRRLVDRMDPRLVNILTVLGFGLPLVGYFVLVHQGSVNTIVSDQLSDLTVIDHSYTHLFDWGYLWAQHNENRIFFPNLIVVLLAHTTAFNVQVEEYLSAVMLTVATALLIWSHKRRSPSTPWLYYCPVALLALSVVQFENALWGFQMAWFLVLLAMATAVVLIDRVTLTWLSMTGAIAAALLGSFSSLQGLLIWPVGLVLLYHRRRSRPFFVVWIVTAVLAGVLYFYHFDPNAGAPQHGYALHHPLGTVKFYVFAVGDILGVPQHYYGPGNNAVLVFGVVILVLAAWTLLAYGPHRDEQGGSPIGVAMVCMGLLFVASVTAGRVLFGYTAASQSRYTTYDLLIPIGILLALLGGPPPRLWWRRSGEPGDPSAEKSSETRRWTRVSDRGDRRLLVAARWVTAVVVLLQVAFGLHYGIAGARKTHAYDVQAANILKSIDHDSDHTVEYSIDVFGQVSFIRRQVRIAQVHHLSVFSDAGGG
jgi:uncharacterized membrane protein YhdT